MEAIDDQIASLESVLQEATLQAIVKSKTKPVKNKELSNLIAQRVKLAKDPKKDENRRLRRKVQK